MERYRRLVLLFGLYMGCAEGLTADTATAQVHAESARLTVAGVVRLPDGSPAADAVVECRSEGDSLHAPVRTDALGAFRFEGVFGDGVRFHAWTDDGELQGLLTIPAIAVRKASNATQTVSLARAVEHSVLVVTSEGRPVADAHVVETGTSFAVRGRTGADGRARLRLPAQDRANGIVAWHPERGVAGSLHPDLRQRLTDAKLVLRAPEPLTIRVRDPSGIPVPGIEMGVSVGTKDAGWAAVSQVDAARVRTDDQGTAIVMWAPREDLQYVDVEPRSSWKVNEIDVSRIEERVVVVTAGLRLPVEGRVALPAGERADGLLVTGFGFGPKHRGDIPYARTRADGSFSLLVPADHGFAMGIVDLDWSSPLWTGLVFDKDGTEVGDLQIHAERAAPVAVHVTRGEHRTPVAGAWIEVARSVSFAWSDHTGTKRSAQGGTRFWTRTDSRGSAQVAAGKGQCDIMLRLHSWKETRKIEVTDREPIEIDFHRKWEGERRISGRLLLGSKPFMPSPKLTALAWSAEDRNPDRPFSVEVQSNGTFEVHADTPKLVLFFEDPERRVSGFAQVGADVTNADIVMKSCATYAGVLIDQDRKPLASQPVALVVKDSAAVPAAIVTTDDEGSFRFSTVPAGVPLTVSIGHASRRSEFYVTESERLFLPGEIRANTVINAQRRGSVPVARQNAPVPLRARVEAACEDVRNSHMFVLLLLQGDGSDHVIALRDRILDGDRSPGIFKFLPVRADASDVKGHKAVLKGFDTLAPAAGTIALVVLDANQKVRASTQLDASSLDAACASARAFLDEHAPVTEDALRAIIAAQDEARATSRRVFVIFGGSRCRPCFTLGRWLEAQHATLEKDFVIVKVMCGLDEHADEVLSRFSDAQATGIPWYAITEPDGTVVATSHSQLGNIGLPSSVEGVRHFRAMLEQSARNLKAAEIDRIVRSLPNSE